MPRTYLIAAVAVVTAASSFLLVDIHAHRITTTPVVTPLESWRRRSRCYHCHRRRHKRSSSTRINDDNGMPLLFIKPPSLFRKTRANDQTDIHHRRHSKIYHTDQSTSTHIDQPPTPPPTPATEPILKTRFRARISYFGTPFHGWQVQPNRSTVQGTIQEVLGRRFSSFSTNSNNNSNNNDDDYNGDNGDNQNKRIVSILGAGRTDAGVHARGQAIHFDLLEGDIPFTPQFSRSFLPPSSLSGGIDFDSSIMNEEEFQKQQQLCTDFCAELQHSMNRMLPLDIRVFNLQLAPYTWYYKQEASSNDNDDDDHDGDASDEYGNTSVFENEVEEEDPLTLPSQSSQSSSPSPQSTQSKLVRGRPWHAIQSANSKWYSYRFALGPTLWNPMDRYRRTHFVHRPIFTPPPPSSSSLSSVRDSGSSSKSNNEKAEPYYALTKTDITKLNSILKLYEGTHDFKAFGGQLEQNEKRAGKKINTIRTVHKVELVKEPLKEDYSSADSGSAISVRNEYDNNHKSMSGVNMSSMPLVSSFSQDDDQLGFIGEEGNYRVDFLLQGALYKMVRNMVGTAIEVWLGRMSEEHLVELLRIHDDDDEEEEEKGEGDDGTPQKKKKKGKKKLLGRRDNPCKPAPPEGLTLECVYYEGDF